jgi:hypothetical protein
LSGGTKNLTAKAKKANKERKIAGRVTDTVGLFIGSGENIETPVIGNSSHSRQVAGDKYLISNFFIESRGKKTQAGQKTTARRPEPADRRAEVTDTSLAARDTAAQTKSSAALTLNLRIRTSLNGADAKPGPQKKHRKTNREGTKGKSTYPAAAPPPRKRVPGY